MQKYQVRKNILLTLTFFLSIIFNFYVIQAEVREDKALNPKRGWYWYEKKKGEGEVSSTKKSATNKLKEISKDLEELKAKAILDPTIENVNKYMLAQQQVTDQAEKFTNSWKLALLMNPDLDASIKSPISNTGNILKETITVTNRTNYIREILKDYVPVLFFDSRSLYSKQFARTIKYFQKKYDVWIKQYSLDGGDIEDLQSEIYHDQGEAEAFGIKNIPSLYLVNPHLKQTILITSCYKTLDIIEENIELIMNYVNKKKEYSDENNN